jgi:fructokinase
VRIGVDLGGTKIEAIALADDGAILERRRVHTPVADYGATLDAIDKLVGAIEKDLSQRGTIGVGSPGAISPRTGLLKNANSTVLNGKPLDKDLSRVLGRAVRLENDANCFALSEAFDGAGSQERIIFGVILGTGVGGGIIVDKSLVSGPNRIAGEWGHNPLPWPMNDERPGPKCYCGKSGCIETFLSGPALSREYEILTGQHLNAREISNKANAGSMSALECVAKYHDRLARSLASIINVLDPDAVVFGGGLSNVAKIYVDLIPSIERYAFSDSLDTKIYRAVHGDSSGVRGAAWLWPNSSENSSGLKPVEYPNSRHA